MRIGVHTKRMGRDWLAGFPYLKLNFGTQVVVEGVQRQRLNVVYSDFSDKGSRGAKWGPLIWSKRGSFFWVGIFGIKHLFTWSTKWRIGTNTAISFWFDNWGPTMLAQPGTRRVNSRISLRQADTIYSLNMAHEFSSEEDTLSWN